MADSSITITSLRGGLNDTDSPAVLESDVCTVAENVEFVDATLAERRLGCAAIDLPGDLGANQICVWMYRHLPTNDEGDAELWALFMNSDGSTNTLRRRTKTAWSTITVTDAIITTYARPLGGQTLHGKLFLAYASAVNRLHVWDGTELRRTGLAEPAAPSVAETGVGTFSGVRYYRVRYTVQDGDGVTLRRSEPSETTTYNPASFGSNGLSARITKPATISEGETHWEAEASVDNANFYVIATTAVGTTTVDDSTDYSSGYATLYELSEDIGDYTLIPSSKFLSVDEDRLITGGSWMFPDEESRFRWTPVYNTPIGAGNDERLELDTDPYMDLDGFQGGGLVGISQSANGYMFALKWSHIYKIIRTGTRTKAYEAFAMSKTSGALPGSIVEAVDQSGRPTVYFTDPQLGPQRVDERGVQWCGRDIQRLWDRVNIEAVRPAHGVYFSERKQIHWWLALDDEENPNGKIVLHVNETRNTDEGARRGWVTVPTDDRIADAICSVMFSPNVDTTDSRVRGLVPFIGGFDAGGDHILRCHTGSTDNGTEYRARVRTRALLPNILNEYSVRAGSILVSSTDTEADQLFVALVRNFGAESVSRELSLYHATEDYLVQRLDSLTLSEWLALQIEIGDLDDDVDPAAYWAAHLLTLKMGPGVKS